MTSIIGSAFFMLISGIVGGFAAISLGDLFKVIETKKWKRGVLIFVIEIAIIFIMTLLLVWWISKNYGLSG